MTAIALLTDFGWTDGYVGAMKGVLYSKAPQASLIDITHGIPRGDVPAGALALRSAYSYYPKGTVFLAVVDPGVGSERQAVAVQDGDFFFAGPDNGLFSFSLSENAAVHLIENPEARLPHVSHTFHGRDVFAPAAAFLATGGSIRDIGSPTTLKHRLPWPEIRESTDGIEGEIICLDHYGNAVTNIDAKVLGRHRLNSFNCRSTEFPLKSFYAETPAGSPLCLVGSGGLLELAAGGGSAAEKWRLQVGDKVKGYF